MNTVNSQPKRVTNEESRYLRNQLQDVRDRINQLLDNLDSHGPVSVTDTADGATDGSRPATAAVSHTASTTSASNAAASFDPLTGQKYTRGGTTTRSVNTGELLWQ